MIAWPTWLRVKIWKIYISIFTIYGKETWLGANFREEVQRANTSVVFHFCVTSNWVKLLYYTLVSRATTFELTKKPCYYVHCFNHRAWNECKQTEKNSPIERCEAVYMHVICDLIFMAAIKLQNIKNVKN